MVNRSIHVFSFPAFALLFLLSAPIRALEITGIDVPEQATLGADNTELTLNGAGIRKKLFIKVYVGALYLAQTADNPTDIYALPGAKRIAMHILYKEISQEKLVDGWIDGFKANLSEAEMQALHKPIQEFNALFRTVKKGEVIHIDYIPGTGTQVRIDNELRGTLAGEEFYTKLLRLWLGDKPADDKLKQAMLGN